MTNKAFKDLFSKQAGDYAKYRPTYPDSLFHYLSALVQEKKAAWDCGTGNGQAALQLTKYFEKIFATDPSQQQLNKADQHPKITYLCAPAEKSDLKDQSVSLVTVAQAFHWFRHEEFYVEVRRVTKPGSILAVWCYGLVKISPEIDSLIDKFYKETLGPYWEKERHLVEEGYQTIPFPFQELKPPPLVMEAHWSLEYLIGYLGTWSAYQTFLKTNKTDPLAALAFEIKKEWGSEPNRTLKWDLAIRVGRI